MTGIGPTNIEIADVLEQMGELLTKRGEPNPYRIQAYLQAAATVRAHPEPLATVYGRGGKKALMDLPGIGAAMADHVAQYVEKGRVALRDRLLAADDPAALFATLPSVSYRLGRRFVDDLGVRTLTDLERAAHDGRLATLPGVGPRTVEAIRLQLNTILHRAARRRVRRVRRQIAQIAAERVRQAAEGEREPARGGTAEPAPESAPRATIYTLFPPAAA